jgi:hypothetical protein
MGLVDDVRNRRDSWTKRFEEHRDFDDSRCEDAPEAEEKRILENRRNVGVFSPKKPDGK